MAESELHTVSLAIPVYLEQLMRTMKSHLTGKEKRIRVLCLKAQFHKHIEKRREGTGHLGKEVG